MNQQPLPHGDEDDPTGIRALLASLPDPGPMPDDVARRIAASIAAEQAALGDGAAPGPVVTPLVRRRPAWQKLGLAAAAVVAVGIAASALTGTSPGEVAAFMTHGDGMTAESSADTAGGAAAGGDSADEGTDGDGPVAAPDKDTTDPLQGPRDLAADGAGASGTAYTSAGLAAQAADARTGWLRGTDPDRTSGEEMAPASPLLTRAGLEDCLKGLGVGGVTLVGADLGTFDGEPAAVLVVGGAGSADVAYAVSPDCSSGSPGRLAGPVPLP